MPLNEQQEKLIDQWLIEIHNDLVKVCGGDEAQAIKLEKFALNAKTGGDVITKINPLKGDFTDFKLCKDRMQALQFLCSPINNAPATKELRETVSGKKIFTDIELKRFTSTDTSLGLYVKKKINASHSDFEEKRVATEISFQFKMQKKEEILKELFKAINSDDFTSFQGLLEKNSELLEKLIGFQNDNGDCLLHLAATSKDPSFLKLLLNMGANLDVKNNKQMTPFHCAVLEGNAKHVEIFLNSEKLGKDNILSAVSYMQKGENSGEFKNGDYKRVKELLEKGAYAQKKRNVLE